MSIYHLAVPLFMLCLLLSVFLFRTKRNLSETLKRLQKYSSAQNSFTKAVAGIEANLEQEKVNSSLLLKILDTIEDGVAIMDRDGMLKYGNAALWRLYQIAPQEKIRYVDKNWIKLHNAKGQAEITAKVLPALNANQVWLGESDVMTQKGELLRAELYIAKSAAGYIGFIRNVSMRHQAEIENRRLSVQLHELKKYEAMERVMRSIVHEFSNSLSAVTGLSELLSEEAGNNSATGIYAKKICACSVQMQFALEKARALLPNAQRTSGFSGFPATTEASLQAAQK